MYLGQVTTVSAYIYICIDKYRNQVWYIQSLLRRFSQLRIHQKELLTNLNQIRQKTFFQLDIVVKYILVSRLSCNCSSFFYLKDISSSVETDEEDKCSNEDSDLPSYQHLKSVKENYQNTYGEENCWKDSINESITETVAKMQSKEEDMKARFEEILKVETAALDFKKELEEKQKVRCRQLIQGFHLSYFPTFSYF